MRLVPLSVLVLCACSGQITTPDPRPPPPGGDACLGGVDPGPLLMRRLTNAEYLASVNWLLSTDATALAAKLPADQKRTGFDNGFELQTISTSHADGYFTAAKTLTDDLFADPARRAALLGCDPAGSNRAPCLKAFLGAFGRRAYRRALTPEETDALFALTETEAVAADGAALAVRAMLQSPKFLFRVEVGAPAAGSAYLKLTGDEVAARLSFFLWGGPPDDALLDAAAAGALDTAAGVEAQAAKMLDDPRAQASFTRFTDQWFGVDAIDGLTRSAADFPTFDAPMKAAMKGELHRLFAEHLWTPGVPMLDVYVTKKGWADAPLAALYGKPAGAIDWSGNADRGGLFTTAGLLALTTRNDFTSAIQRGLYVRETVLCEKISLPAGGVPQLAQMPGESQLEAEQRHTKDPNCSSCHKRIDPVGAGLERYDAIGALRTTYPNGKPVAQAGRVEGLATAEYAGGVELGARVRAAPESTSCAVKHLFRWSFARRESPRDDLCALEQLGAKFEQSGLSFRSLVLATVTNDAFRYRRPGD